MVRDTLRITLAQINPVVGAIESNAARIAEIYLDGAAKGSDLVVFPEMALCGYPPEDLVLKPFFMDCVHAACDRLAALTKQHPAGLLLPTPIRDSGRLFNACLLLGEGKILDIVKKHHLPNYGVFDEMRLFSAGALPEPVSWQGLKIGLMICEDMWHPDVAAHLKKRGADLLVSVNASPFEQGKSDVRQHHARQRAEETALPLFYLNQTGGQDELIFDGASFVIGEGGDLLIQSPEFVEHIQPVTLKRTAHGHWLCETRALAPVQSDLALIYQALVMGIRDYVTKNGFSGVLIGVSGGIDSALCAALAVDALGGEAVHCVMMPSPYTSPQSQEDSRTLTSLLGARLETIPIHHAMTVFGDLLEPHLEGCTSGVTQENIQSRIRGLILMGLSNASGHMLLSTGNKSEMAVGYATLYGDMCGGFNPLKDIYKTKVYALAAWRNAHKPLHGFGSEGQIIPQRILTRAPTAELKPDQTDQDTLPPYPVLDDILMCLIERDMGLPSIVERGHSPELVVKIWRMLDSAEYKRRQAPPGIKISSRAFGRDRRYPITGGSCPVTNPA